MRHTSGRRLLPMLVLALSLGVPTALAHFQVKIDRNDTAGRLDIRSAGLAHNRNDINYVVRTWEGWPKRFLEKRGKIYIYLDAFGNADPDYISTILKDSLFGFVCETRTTPRDRFVARTKAGKSSSDTVTCPVPRSELRQGIGRVFWVVQTQRKEGSGGFVYDFAPDQGTFGHTL